MTAIALVHKKTGHPQQDGVTYVSPRSLTMGDCRGLRADALLVERAVRLTADQARALRPCFSSAPESKAEIANSIIDQLTE